MLIHFLFFFLFFLCGDLGKGTIARGKESRVNHSNQHHYFTRPRAREEAVMANINESGLSQEQTNDARMEEMQAKLRDQRPDMA